MLALHLVQHKSLQNHVISKKRVTFGVLFELEIARPQIQFVINRYEWFWKFSKLHEPLGKCNLRIFKITSTYYSQIVRGRVIFELFFC